MQTPLDEALFRLMDAHAGWASVLDAEDAELLLRRRQGATLKELSGWCHLTPAAVRHRLYGAGTGSRRRGGVLGRLRGLALRHRHSLKLASKGA